MTSGLCVEMDRCLEFARFEELFNFNEYPQWMQSLIHDGYIFYLNGGWMFYEPKGEIALSDGDVILYNSNTTQVYCISAENFNTMFYTID